jgi:hypothetical protein
MENCYKFLEGHRDNPRTGWITLHPAQTITVNPIRQQTRYLGVTLDDSIWSPRVDQVRKKSVQRLGMPGPLRNMKSDMPSGTDSCCISSSSVLWCTSRAPHEVSLTAHMSGSSRYYIPIVFALPRVPPGMIVVDRFTRISMFHSSLNIVITASVSSKLAD